MRDARISQINDNDVADSDECFNTDSGDDLDNDDDDDSSMFYNYYFECPVDLSVDINRPFNNQQQQHQQSNNNRTTAISGSGRLRYTCFDVTANFSIPVCYTSSINGNVVPDSGDDNNSRLVALGTTSGSVRVYLNRLSSQAISDIVSSSTSPESSRPPPRSFSSGSFPQCLSSHNLCSSLPSSLVNAGNDLDSSSTSSSSSIPPTSISPPLSSPNQLLHHYLTIIQTEVVGSVTTISFAPIYNCQSDQQNGNCSYSDDEDVNDNLTDYLVSDSHDGNSHNNGNGDSYSNDSHHNHQLMPNKIILAIGTAKGNLVIVELESFFDNQNSNSSYLNQSKNVFLGGNRSVTSGSYSKRWKVIYHGKTFTTHSITALKWDNTNRLFITDSYGQLFVLVDIESIRHLTALFTVPTLLLTLNGIGIYQIDIASEKLVVFSTSEQRVFLLNLTNSNLCQIGGNSKKQVPLANKSMVGATIGGGGVCFLSNYRLVELVNYNDSFDWNRDRNDDEEIDYIEKTYRLISTECQLFCTRPKWRVWVVNVPDGQIEFTHQFNGLIQESDTTTPETATLTNKTGKDLTGNETNRWKHQLTKHVTFGKLYPMYWYSRLDRPSSPIQMHNYLVTYSSYSSSNNGLVCSWIYVIDPKHQTIIATSPPFNGSINDIRCVCNEIFVSYSQSTIGQLNGNTNHRSTTTTKSSKFSTDFNLCLLTIKIQCPEEEHLEEQDKAEEVVEEKEESLNYSESQTVSELSPPPLPEVNLTNTSETTSQSISEVNNNDNYCRTQVDNQTRIEQQLDIEQLKLAKLALQLGIGLTDLDQDDDLFDAVGSSSFGLAGDWKCHCGLPLLLQSKELTGKCLLANSETKIFSILDNCQAELSLSLGPDSDTLFQLLELAYCRANWPVYMALLARLDEIKFYLYFSILLDQPCLLLGQHYQNRTIHHRLRDDLLWQNCFDFINYCALEMIDNDDDDENEDSRLDRSLFVPNVPIMNSQQRMRKLRNQDNGSCGDIEAVVDQRHPKICILCQLKHLNRTNQFEVLARFFETRFLQYTLLYCSTKTVSKIWSQIMDKISLPLNQNPVKTMVLFSPSFYLLLLRFKILELSTSQSTIEYLKQFKNKKKAINLNNRKLLSKGQGQGQSSGLIFDLSKVNCSFCNLPIISKSQSPNSTSTNQRRSTIKLYQNCRHLYHLSCDHQSGSGSCWLCHNNSTMMMLGSRS